MNFYRILYKLFADLFRRLFRVEVKGAENIPKDGAVIVCSNHISAFDPFIIIVSNIRQIYFMAKKELFRIPVLHLILKCVGVFPVDRQGNDVGAIKHAIRLLKNGEPFGIFPQGTRHTGEDPHTTEVRSGVGLIEEKTRADILPCCILTDGNRIKFFKRTIIVYGKVLKASEFDGIISSDELSSKEKHLKISEKVFDEILTLIDGENNER